MENEKVKCILCNKRMVLQREWKKEYEKTRCVTCITFLKYVFALEKALRENMEAIGMQNKELHIEIYKETNAQRLERVCGIKFSDSNKIDKEL